jgi:hypothetical protein
MRTLALALLVLSPLAAHAQTGQLHLARELDAPADCARGIDAADWLACTEVDLVDPFGGFWAWDPIRSAVGTELIDPFHTWSRFEYLALLDPFAPAPAPLDLCDPWAEQAVSPLR